MASTLAQLRTAVRERADLVNSQFVTDAELTGYVNASAYELYDLITQKYGDNYNVATPHLITMDGVSEQYALPADFFKLLGVDLQLGNVAASWVTIKPFNFSDRNRYAVPNFQSFYGVTNLRYRLNGSQIWFTPIPAGGQTVRIWYVPRMTPLVGDSDSLDGVSGWEEYVVVDAAIKCLLKEESDPAPLMAVKQGLIARIEAAAENRDAGSPARVADSMWNEMWWPSGNGQGGGML